MGLPKAYDAVDAAVSKKKSCGIIVISSSALNIRHRRG
jgi:hypothetical protein